MRSWYAAAACAGVLALTGCGSGSSADEPGAESSVVVAPTDDQGATSPDSPEVGDDQASADLPSLPIGGNASFDAGSTTTCAFLAWNGGTLPDGVVVRILELEYPTGISQDTSASCDGPPCLDADSFTPDQQTCSVGLAWDGSTPAEAEPSISAVGKAFCESQDVCDQLKSDAADAGGVADVQLPPPSDTDSSSS